MRLIRSDLFIFYVKMIALIFACTGFYSSCSEQGFGCGESFWDF